MRHFKDKRWKKHPLEGARPPMQPRNAQGIQVSCAGKVCWWSQERADQQAKEINQRRIGDRPVRAYHCRTNSHGNAEVWHVGRAKL